jgi:hypothetical protein
MKTEISLEDANKWLKERGLDPFPIKSITIDASTETQSAEGIKKLLEDWIWKQQAKKY